MRVYTCREAMKDAIRGWLGTYERYSQDRPMTWTKGIPLGHYVDRVRALNPDTCTREEMNAALGKDGWGQNPCDQCGTDSPALMRFGDEPDYEARWQDLCADCLSEAAATLSAPATSS